MLECVGDYGCGDGKERVEQLCGCDYVDNAQVPGSSGSLVVLKGELDHPEEDHHVCHPQDVQLHWHGNGQHSCNRVTIGRVTSEVTIY